MNSEDGLVSPTNISVEEEERNDHQVVVVKVDDTLDRVMPDGAGSVDEDLGPKKAIALKKHRQTKR